MSPFVLSVRWEQLCSREGFFGDVCEASAYDVKCAGEGKRWGACVCRGGDRYPGAKAQGTDPRSNRAG